ncbi:Invasion protein B [Agrobacterium tumefaciens]|nr:Invasion protein B [Agrobacterium tumefaciens]
MMQKANTFTRTALSALVLSLGAVSAPAISQAQDAAPAAQGGAGAPPLGWFKTCSKQEDNDVCVVQNVVLAQNGQMITAVGLITVEGKVNRKLLQVSVPTARLIPPGVMMQIDGGKGQKLDYAVCLPDKCTAEVPLTDAMIASLKKGSEVVFTSINFRRAPNPIKIALSGFTGAYDGAAITQSQLAESQRSLQEGMQKKAEEARKKLEAAQDAAKAPKPVIATKHQE